MPDEIKRQFKPRSQQQDKQLLENMAKHGWTEAHYEAALASSQTGTFENRLKTGISLWSGTLRDLYGLDDSVEADDEAWLSRVHPADRPAARAAVASSKLQQCGDFGYEYRIQHPTRGLRWLQVRGRVLQDTSDTPDLTLGTVVDITEHRIVEQRYAQRAQQQETVARLGRQALAGQDLAGLMGGIAKQITDVLDIEYCGIYELLPDSQELLLTAGSGWRAGRVGQARISSTGNTAAASALLQDEPVFISDLRTDSRFDNHEQLRDLDIASGLSLMIHGTSGPWGVLGVYSTRPERFSSDDVHFIMAIANVLADAIARAHWEQQLRDARSTLELRVNERTAQLQASNRELEAFAYSVSHDLRAPLRSIDGFSQVLVEDYQSQLDNTAQDYLLRIRRASERMGELINDLLSLSRVASREPNRSEMNLSLAVAAFTDELAARESERDVLIELQPDVRAVADPKLVRIALENLLHNAWKFTRYRRTPVIAFGLLPGQDPAVFFVRDNGIGFDMSQATRLFSPFQRLHPAEQFEGTGIGLATAQRIIHRHGGAIWAESQPGEGTTIFFTLAASLARQQRGG